MNLDYVRGLLTDSSPHQATIEVMGLGLRIFIPVNAFDKLPACGKETLLYISTIIREDSHRYYGFLTKRERNFFEVLIDISGVGPKIALALLGHLSLDDLALAVHHGNAKGFSNIPGIGKKIAERLIIELRDKIKDFPPSAPSGISSDAINALINLGQNPLDAQRAVALVLEQKAGQQTPLSELISLALKQSAKRK